MAAATAHIGGIAKHGRVGAAGEVHAGGEDPGEREAQELGRPARQQEPIADLPDGVGLDDHADAELARACDVGLGRPHEVLDADSRLAPGAALCAWATAPRAVAMARLPDGVDGHRQMSPPRPRHQLGQVALGIEQDALVDHAGAARAGSDMADATPAPSAKNLMPPRRT